MLTPADFLLIIFLLPFEAIVYSPLEGHATPSSAGRSPFWVAIIALPQITPNGTVVHFYQIQQRRTFRASI